MRRITSFIGIILLALLASGWSNVLATALCPNMQVASCCLMKMKHKSASSHEAMAMDGMEMDSAEMMTAVDVEANSISQSTPACALCLNRSELPIKSVVMVNLVRDSRRDLSAAPDAAVPGSLAPFSSLFALPVTSRQHAPPVTSTSRHVLINVFLI